MSNTDEALAAYTALLYSTDGPQRQELLAKTKDCPEYELVAEGGASFAVTIPAMAMMPPEAVITMLTCFVQAIWFLGVQVGQRMNDMPNFVVQGEDEND